MAQRKIKLTLSGLLSDSVGPIVDVDFNGVNVDLDLAVTEAQMVREYSIDVDAGEYSLGIDFKNDDVDRDLMIHRVDISNDGSDNWERVVLSDSNTTGFNRMQIVGWHVSENNDYDPGAPIGSENSPFSLNPSFDAGQPRTDEEGVSPGFVFNESAPGDNAMHMYEEIDTPAIAYIGGTKAITISFT